MIAGPNAGQTSHPANTGTCVPAACTTNASGQVSWTYTSNGTAGTDTIQACFPERPAGDHRAVGDDVKAQCQTVAKIWAAATATSTATPTNTVVPISTVAPIRVGGVADVHINGGPGSSVADAGSGGSGTGHAMAISLATAAALAMAAGGWYLRRRLRS